MYRLMSILSNLDVICVMGLSLVLSACDGGGSSRDANNGSEVSIVSSLSPTQSYAGGADFTLTVNGNDFADNAIVRWNGVDCVTTFVSDNQLEADIVAADIADTGIAEVTVFDPASEDISTGIMFHVIEYPLPTVSHLSPTQVQAGGAEFILTVDGSNFTADSEILWDSNYRTSTLVNSNQLQATISVADIASAGTVDVTVFNPAPGGGFSVAQVFTIVTDPVPTISSLDPAQAGAGDADFTLTVNGSDFGTDAVIRWNGADRTTTFISSNQLEAAISAADIAVAGNADITVTNPSGGITSDVSTFTIVNGVPWSGIKQLGATGTVTDGNAVAVDISGNVIVAGYTNGDLDGNIRTGLIDFYVTKYDSSGVRQFTRQLGVVTKPTYGYSVATDSDNNIYVTGYTLGNLDAQIMLGTWGMFVTKYDSDGNKQFTSLLTAMGSTTSAKAIAVDSSDNLYIAGYTTGGLNGEMLTGNQDMFLVKLNNDGYVIFTRLLGAAGKSAYGQSVAADDSGNVYVAGYTSGGLDGNTMTGLLDLFVTKYDSSGSRQFTRQLGAPGKLIYAQSVAVDDSSNIYVTGYTNADLDGNIHTGSTDMFLTKYDSVGTKISTTMLGVSGSTVQGLSVAIDSMSNVYITGYTDAGIDGNVLTGNSDAYLVKYDGSGSMLFARQFGAAGSNTSGRGLVVDGSDNIFVSGSTTGGIDGNILNGASDFFVAKYDYGGVRQ